MGCYYNAFSSLVKILLILIYDEGVIPHGKIAKTLDTANGLEPTT